MLDDFSKFLSGEKLYGDDLSNEEIAKWFADEAEGYANLGAKDTDQYSYGYHQLNYLHAFNKIKNNYFNKALGIGSAYGDELKPIVDNISEITILDPSEVFAKTKFIKNTPCIYTKPNVNGDLSFENNYFDLITSLGVLHHIPNVSHVMKECHRCLTDGGIMLLREPIVSMGDWRVARKGLTKRERGIPLKIMDFIIKNNGFKVKYRSVCNFPLIPKITNKFGVSAYNSYPLTVADKYLSKIFHWNLKYNRINFYDKIAPASIYYVLEK